MSATPVLLLDIDGVINVDHSEWDSDLSVGHAYANGRRYTMRWAPEVIAELQSLVRERYVTIRWCTTWCAFITQFERLWGLPVADVAFTEDVNGRVAAHAKWAAARLLVEQNHRFIWIDDTEVPTSGPAYDDLTSNGNALLLSPYSRTGITPDHVELIHDFLGKF